MYKFVAFEEISLSSGKLLDLHKLRKLYYYVFHSENTNFAGWQHVYSIYCCINVIKNTPEQLLDKEKKEYLVKKLSGLLDRQIKLARFKFKEVAKEIFLEFEKLGETPQEKKVKKRPAKKQNRKICSWKNIVHTLNQLKTLPEVILLAMGYNTHGAGGLLIKEKKGDQVVCKLMIENLGGGRYEQACTKDKQKYFPVEIIIDVKELEKTMEEILLISCFADNNDYKNYFFPKIKQDKDEFLQQENPESKPVISKVLKHQLRKQIIQKLLQNGELMKIPQKSNPQYKTKMNDLIVKIERELIYSKVEIEAYLDYFSSFKLEKSGCRSDLLEAGIRLEGLAQSLIHYEGDKQDLIKRGIRTLSRFCIGENSFIRVQAKRNLKRLIEKIDSKEIAKNEDVFINLINNENFIASDNEKDQILAVNIIKYLITKHPDLKDRLIAKLFGSLSDLKTIAKMKAILVMKDLKTSEAKIIPYYDVAFLNDCVRLAKLNLKGLREKCLRIITSFLLNDPIKAEVFLTGQVARDLREIIKPILSGGESATIRPYAMKILRGIINSDKRRSIALEDIKNMWIRGDDFITGGMKEYGDAAVIMNRYLDTIVKQGVIQETQLIIMRALSACTDNRLMNTEKRIEFNQISEQADIENILIIKNKYR
ncbi:hypothetical protein ACFLZV_05310 [Candidatus Margulisiibacteriota bacterium]